MIKSNRNEIKQMLQQSGGHRRVLTMLHLGQIKQQQQQQQQRIVCATSVFLANLGE